MKRIAFAAALALAFPAAATVTAPPPPVAYVCNGSTTTYTISFPYISASHVTATVTTAGVVTTLSQPADFTVTPSIAPSVGTLKFVAGSRCPNGSVLNVGRSVPLTQPTSLRNGAYKGEVVEQALDRSEMQIQQLQSLFTNPPATILPSNVTAKLNGIRFADQFANIQAAITDAGTTGAVIIPPGYSASDTFTNPNAIRILDLRGGAVSNGGIPAKAFGVRCDDSTDDTSRLQSALTYAASVNGTLLIGPGICRVSSTLTLTGNQTAGTGLAVTVAGFGQGFSTHGTSLKWTGADAAGTVLFKVDGVHRFSMNDIMLTGQNTVETLFFSTEHVSASPPTYSGYGWRFTNVNFEAVRANGVAFSISDTTTNQSRYVFTGCTFQPATENASGALVPTGTKAFYSTNQNALDHTFIGCEFSQADYGIYMAGGSFKVYSTDFTRHAVADLFVQANSVSSVIGSWSEQSRQFLIGSNGAAQPLVTMNIIDTRISSNPWAYWKHFESTRTQPTNDYTQWAAIVWDRGAPLNLIGVVINDPYLGVSQGAVAPLTSSTPIVLEPNGQTRPYDINLVGSSSSVGLVPTVNFVQLGSVLMTPRTTVRKMYNTATTGSSLSVDLDQGSFLDLTLNANTTITLNTTHAEAGDKLTLIFKQIGAANFTVTFVNVNLLGGAFVPLTGLNVRSGVILQFNGTTWDEVSRTKGT